jgi:hypothetical protein
MHYLNQVYLQSKWVHRCTPQKRKKIKQNMVHRDVNMNETGCPNTKIYYIILWLTELDLLPIL